MARKRFAMVTEAMLSDHRLTGRQFKVLCALRMFADSKTGEAHPKRLQLTDATGIAENKIADDTRVLERLGWLSKKGNGGRSMPTIYTMFDEPKTYPETGYSNQPQNRVGIKKETYPDSGLNLPRNGVKTYPDSGVKPTPKQGSASNRPITDQEQTNNIPVANRKKSPAPANADAPLKIQLSDSLKQACKETWEAYAEAYRFRYGVDPVRNAKLNRNVIDFCKRIPQDEAPLIARHYVASNAAFYVTRGHQFGNLLADAEKLRTEWATGKTMTNATARQIDATQSNFNSVEQAKQMLAARG